MDIFVQCWEESEAGWGTRPDGFSLHSSQEDVAEYIQKYWDRMPKEVPHEYERPFGKPIKIELNDQEMLFKIEDSPHGIRVYRNFEDNSFYRRIQEIIN